MAYLVPHPPTQPLGRLVSRKVKMKVGNVSPTIPIKPSPGFGYLAGDHPEGITRVEGEPTPATIRVHYRAESGTPGDGVLVAEVQSNADGTWLVEGLNPDLKFDVICRYPGYNDMILSNVSPVLAAGLQFSGEFSTLDSTVEILLGTGPYQVDVVDGALPPGVEIQVAGDVMALVGTPEEWGQFYFVVRVIDSAGISGVFASELDAVKLLPDELGEFFGGGYYIGNVVVADGGVDDGEYVVIMAGQEGDAALKWKDPNGNTPGTTSPVNGLSNTLAMQANNPDMHPAGMYCLTYSGAGFDDWYLPARAELLLAWENRSYLPELGMNTSQFYWSSTQSSSNNAVGISMGSGAVQTAWGKTNTRWVRPVRRIRVPDEN